MNASFIQETEKMDCCTGVLPLAAEHAAYARDGWVVLRGLVQPSSLQGMHDEVLAVLRVRNQPDSFLAQAQEYLAGGYLDRWINSPGLAAIASSFLEIQARLFMAFTAVKGPHQGAFGFHQDNNYTPMRAPGAFRWGLNCWLALVPMRVSNGCLRVVSDTHRHGVSPWQDSTMNAGHREVAATPTHWNDIEIEAGDVCVFDRNTIHGSGPNDSDAPRIAYGVQFHRADAEAFFDDSWELLTKRPRYVVTPRTHLTCEAQRTE